MNCEVATTTGRGGTMIKETPLVVLMMNCRRGGVSAVSRIKNEEEGLHCNTLRYAYFIFYQLSNNIVNR